ncbi:MAG: aldehyde dehydrogenase family protein, partial [Rubricoccaceae bacterium]|nr:aldehyde dehydrogenase family protein [Rubricoccaceae bacterium]
IRHRNHAIAMAETTTVNGTSTEVQTFQNYIGGEWRDAASGETFEDRNPTQQSDLIGRCPKSSADDVNAAVEAARAAYDGWRLTPAPA